MKKKNVLLSLTVLLFGLGITAIAYYNTPIKITYLVGQHAHKLKPMVRIKHKTPGMIPRPLINSHGQERTMNKLHLQTVLLSAELLRGSTELPGLWRRESTCLPLLANTI